MARGRGESYSREPMPWAQMHRDWSAGRLRQTASGGWRTASDQLAGARGQRQSGNRSDLNPWAACMRSVTRAPPRHHGARAEGSDDPSRMEVIACFLVPARAGSVGQGMTTQRQQRRRVAATLLLGVFDAER